MSKYYFAYGSNLSRKAMAMRCPTAKPVGKGILKDYQLVYRGGSYGYLTVEPKKGSSVPIGVWEIEERDEKNLDMYEGYPRLYRKQIVKIPVQRFKSKDSTTVVSEDELSGLIYIMNDGYGKARPTQEYLFVCLVGYMDFDLPVDELDTPLLDLENSRK